MSSSQGGRVIVPFPRGRGTSLTRSLLARYLSDYCLQFGALNWAAEAIKRRLYSDATRGQLFAFFRRPQRDDGTPAMDSDGGNMQRIGDLAAGLEKGQRGALEHLKRTLTTVSNQAQLCATDQARVITLVNMKTTENNTLAERLADAMHRANVTAPLLARECGVSAVAVHKWLAGKTKVLRNDTCTRAAAALKVNRAWLSDGKGPRTGVVATADFNRELLLTLRRQMEAGIAQIDAMLKQQNPQAVKRSSKRRQRASIIAMGDPKQQGYVDGMSVTIDAPPRARKKSA